MAAARLTLFRGLPIDRGRQRKIWWDDTVLNFRVGKCWRDYGVFIDVLNAFDSSGHDIDCLNASHLAGEATNVIVNMTSAVGSLKTL